MTTGPQLANQIVLCAMLVLQQFWTKFQGKPDYPHPTMTTQAKHGFLWLSFKGMNCQNSPFSTHEYNILQTEQHK